MRQPNRHMLAALVSWVLLLLGTPASGGSSHPVDQAGKGKSPKGKDLENQGKALISRPWPTELSTWMTGARVRRKRDDVKLNLPRLLAVTEKKFVLLAGALEEGAVKVDEFCTALKYVLKKHEAHEGEAQEGVGVRIIASPRLSEETVKKIETTFKSVRGLKGNAEIRDLLYEAQPHYCVIEQRDQDVVLTEDRHLLGTAPETARVFPDAQRLAYDLRRDFERKWSQARWRWKSPAPSDGSAPGVSDVAERL